MRLPTNSLNFRDMVSLFFIYLFIAMIFLCLIFLPVIVIPFVHHDDYTFFVSHDRTVLFSYPQYVTGIRLGRIFQMLINSIYDKWIDTVDDLNIIRGISVFFTGISLALFAVWLRLLSFNKIIAFFISACIFTLPGAQFYIFFVNGSSMAIAVFLALLSAIFIEQVEPRAILSFRRFIIPDLRTVIFAFLSFLSLFISINTYQVPPMFYLVPTLAIILFNSWDKWPETRLKVIRNLGLFGIVLLTYFIVHRLITLPYLMSRYPNVAKYMAEPSMYQFKITANIFDKIKFLINDLSFQCLNLWNIYPNRFIALSVALLIFICAIVSGVFFLQRVRSNGRENIVTYMIQVIGLVVLLLLLANTPNLLAAGGYPSYRTLFPYSGMIVLLVVWSLRSLILVLPQKMQSAMMGGIIGLIILIASFVAQYNMLTSVFNANLELSFLRAKVVEHLSQNKNLTGIHVIRRKGDLSFLGLPGRYDEFNAPSSAYPQDISMMIHSFLRIGEAGKYGLIVTKSFPTITTSSTDDSSLVYISPDGILIDMNDLLIIPTESTVSMYKRKREIAMVTVSAATSGPGHGGGSAFDYSNAPDSFWEAGGFFPQWIKLTYSASKKIIGYEIQTAEGVERSPKAWQLQGSNDGVKWIDLDKRENQIDWKPNEKRTYHVENPGAYKYYRFFFTEGNDPILRVYEIRIIYALFPADREEETKDTIGTKVSFGPILVIEGYKEFNIIAYGDKFYGLAQNEGAFDIRKVEANKYKKCFVGGTIDEVKHLIDKALL